MFKELDVIIPTNKKLSYLKNLIFLINNQKGNFKINIILIHQSSKKEDLPNFLLKNNIFYKRILIQNLSNAKNEGLKISKSKIFTVLDDDIIISKNYFYEAMNILNQTKNDLIFFKINKFNSNIPLSRNMKNFDQIINYKNCNCCLSSTMWFNKKNKQMINFDKNFGLGAKYGSADETDFIYRCLQKNKKIKYISKNLVYHPWEFDNLKNLKSIYAKFFSYGVGQGALYKKHLENNKKLFLYLLILSLLKSLAGIIIYMLTLKKKNIIKYFAMFCGKIIGFKNYNKID